MQPAKPMLAPHGNFEHFSPQATEADNRGSEIGILSSSKFGWAWTSRLFSIISFFMWFSSSWGERDRQRQRNRKREQGVKKTTQIQKVS